MTAAEAHWQVHGRIIKDFLTRMDTEIPVCSAGDFQKNLRQAFAAKNSLSRIHGFTPEQCFLGKARALPGSLTSDEQVSSHAWQRVIVLRGCGFVKVYKEERSQACLCTGRQ